MLDAARRMLRADPEILVRDSLGLAALCVTILAGFCLPALM
ncbi:hypothetical protein HNP73_000558 [Amaricoccus macauensis]|uniref:Uncharacterized protein n=1 Tax=Amaricoccus macauensis TaxID=57001 RepID=A0A840SFK6_9RHOB|nr:hypothetical protein [Amaricoccus macauensis]MBB5220637.1 hypothetical protein [Amaricoccus macauensis]